MGCTQRHRVLLLRRQTAFAERAEWNSYLQFQAVVLHLEVHAGRSDVKGDPLPSVERHLQPRNRGGTVTEAWKRSKRFVRSITAPLPEESIQFTAGGQAVTLAVAFWLKKPQRGCVEFGRLFYASPEHRKIK